MTQQTPRQLHRADASGWPPHIHQLSLDEMDGFGIDADRQLYWHGKPVKLRKRLELTFLERLFALIGIAGAAIGGLAAALGVYLTHFS